MDKKSFRNTCISAFVIVWILVFHYESTRHFYLEPFFKRNLPKVKFLFPPAGWIMFFNVDDDYGATEIYGIKGGKPHLIDPHKILLTRFIGFDNIYRNVLSGFLSPHVRGESCRFLKRKFPEFENFYIVAISYPSVSRRPFERYQTLMYDCSE